MTDPHASGASYDDVLQRIQDALAAVGTVERAIGDLNDEAARNLTRDALNTAVQSLQSVRDRLARSVGTR